MAFLRVIEEERHGSGQTQLSWLTGSMPLAVGSFSCSVRSSSFRKELWQRAVQPMQTSRLHPQTQRGQQKGKEGKPVADGMGLSSRPHCCLQSWLPLAECCRSKNCSSALSLVYFLQVKTARDAETVAEIHLVVAENLEL